MKKLRKIIEIDEEKCTGCGECILACAEGALELVDGKARMIGEIYCDGLGACIGECPEDALRIIEREAEDFDEKAVEELLEKRKMEEHAAVQTPDNAMACGCPGAMARSFAQNESQNVSQPVGELRLELGHWPIKLQLLGPQAEFLRGADLVLMADCTGFSYPGLHRQILHGRAIAIGCPKLDDLDAHITRLAEIIEGAKPRSLTIVHMEVPCCRGFVHAALRAMELSGTTMPLHRIMIGVRGDILEEEDIESPVTETAARSE